MITSLTNPQIKQLVRLRQRRERDKTGTFVIEGARTVMRAAAAGWPLVEGFYAPALAHARAHRAAAELTMSGVPVTEVADEPFRKAAYAQHPDGVLAIGTIPDTAIDEISVSATALLLIVEAIEKPGNLGAMLRTADGAGADAVVIVDPTADPWNPNTVRASQGALFTMAMATADAATVKGWLAGHGINVFGATLDPAPPPWEADFTPSCAVVIGSEHMGLSAAWSGAAPIRIPMRGAGDSLNAAVAASILLYEAVRQRS